MEITKSPDGRTILQMWREGDAYFEQKSPVFLNECTNIMFSGRPPAQKIKNVYYVNIAQESLDFRDNSFDVVYTYHLFEHLSLKEGTYFASEVKRVLKPGGFFRISVPDLEKACRNYILYLEKSLEDPNPDNIIKYKWSVMSIFDQMVRDTSGGLMFESLKKGEYSEEYLIEYYSDVFKPIIKTAQQVAEKEKKRATSPYKMPPHKVIVSKIKQALIKWLLKDQLVLPRNHPMTIKELERWRHDQLSLRLLLDDVGFVEINKKDFNQSDIPNWDAYDFDKSNYGDYPLEASSVYVECKKISDI